MSGSKRFGSSQLRVLLGRTAAVNQDLIDLLRAFADQHVEYLVVGAHALAAHGHVRATKDLDVWIRPTPLNAGRAYRALGAFGVPLSELTEADLATPGTVFQIGVAPVRASGRLQDLADIERLEGRGATTKRVLSTGSSPGTARTADHRPPAQSVVRLFPFDDSEVALGCPCCAMVSECSPRSKRATKTFQPRNFSEPPKTCSDTARVNHVAERLVCR